MIYRYAYCNTKTFIQFFIVYASTFQTSDFTSLLNIAPPSPFRPKSSFFIDANIFIRKKGNAMIVTKAANAAVKLADAHLFCPLFYIANISTHNIRNLINETFIAKRFMSLNRSKVQVQMCFTNDEIV